MFSRNSNSKSEWLSMRLFDSCHFVVCAGVVIPNTFTSSSMAVVGLLLRGPITFAWLPIFLLASSWCPKKYIEPRNQFISSLFDVIERLWNLYKNRNSRFIDIFTYYISTMDCAERTFVPHLLPNNYITRRFFEHTFCIRGCVE